MESRLYYIDLHIQKVTMGNSCLSETSSGCAKCTYILFRVKLGSNRPPIHRVCLLTDIGKFHIGSKNPFVGQILPLSPLAGLKCPHWTRHDQIQSDKVLDLCFCIHRGTWHSQMQLQLHTNAYTHATEAHPVEGRPIRSQNS